MRIHLLDVGKTQYGDCLLITRGDRKILIDGAHTGDGARIRSQLKTLLGQNPPFTVDLLVVTHCHEDHIGCLPKLVAEGELKARTALVADPKLGWGRDADGLSPVDALGLSDRQRGLVTALLEEDHADLPRAELEQFLSDAATLEERYNTMLEQLVQEGTQVVLHGRAPTAQIREIETALAEFGLKILGPTRDHLVKCADAIARASDAFARAVLGDVAADADLLSLARSYRTQTRKLADAALAADQPGIGAAKNDQSLVLKVEADGWSALLAGDMQFAKPEVPGLNPFVDALRQKIDEEGPYQFIKLTHHTSYNAVDASVLDEWSATRLFAHTGGINDASHPDEGVLELLESRQDQLLFARTDRNGLITVERTSAGLELNVARGQLNDFRVNVIHDLPEPVSVERPEVVTTTTSVATVEQGEDRGVVEVIARLPHTATKVTLTIQVEPAAKKKPLPVPGPAVSPSEPDVGELRLASGRLLPRLLFVTRRSQLQANIGRTEADRVLAAFDRDPSVRVLDLPTAIRSAEQAAATVRSELAARSYAGVVLVGGYDVVPAHRLDVLDSDLRRELANAGLEGDDADDFIVWSDEIYGDRDGDFIPELPVSRIPDGRRADLVIAAIQAPYLSLDSRFGVRNLHRPFAEKVFPRLPGQGGKLEISETYSPEKVPPGAAAGAVYLMLHGSAQDATRFWGETNGGEAYEAVGVENVPERAVGSIVFTGCCWGALAASPPAARARPETPLQPRGPEASMAMAYLKAGALAFVGCTGAHYSPTVAPYDYYGKPMHEAFWLAIAQAKRPAEALFQAKRAYAQRMPHGRTDPFSRAVELKILRQYTCLGLGW